MTTQQTTKEHVGVIPGTANSLFQTPSLAAPHSVLTAPDGRSRLQAKALVAATRKMAGDLFKVKSPKKLAQRDAS